MPTMEAAGSCRTRTLSSGSHQGLLAPASGGIRSPEDLTYGFGMCFQLSKIHRVEGNSASPQTAVDCMSMDVQDSQGSRATSKPLLAVANGIRCF